MEQSKIGDVHEMKYRWEIINYLIAERGYKKYFEIGVKDGTCFNQVKCAKKYGIDIKPLIVNPHVKAISSDEFFETTPSILLDIIFIDGDHHEEQVSRDVHNSLKCLVPNGTIVMHDCNPKVAEHAAPERKEGQILWSGTAYRSYLKLRRTNPEIAMFVVDIDWGCGIIQHGCQNLLDIPDDPTWDEFDEKRVSWLDLVTVDEFKRRIL